MIKIRSVSEDDLEVLSKIYALVYEKFDVGEKWDFGSSKKLLLYWFKRQPDLFLIAEDNNEIVGAFVAGIKPWWDGNHLVDGEVFVHPDFQGKRIGTELSKEIYRRALENYSVVSWDSYTFKKTDFPLSWYKSQGFEENSDWVMFCGSVKNALSYLEEK